MPMKKLASFPGFLTDLNGKYEIICERNEDWFNCDDFLIPIDRKLNPLVDLSDFSPTFFGKLHPAFNFDSKHQVEPNFVGCLLNSTAGNRVQRLHFYVSKGFSIDEIIESVERRTSEILHRPWCENLLPYIEAADNHTAIVYRTKSMIFVKDRFAKSIVHYLCIPRKRIDTWWFLKPEDVDLLLEMKEESRKFSERLMDELGSDEFKFGFHVIPSMKQLHLHIISIDFASPNLNPVQWNAFNTPFLVTIDQVISELKEKGGIAMPPDRLESYRNMLFEPLRCPLCDKRFRKLDGLLQHYHLELKHRNGQ